MIVVCTLDIRIKYNCRNIGKNRLWGYFPFGIALITCTELISVECNKSKPIPFYASIFIQTRKLKLQQKIAQIHNQSIALINSYEKQKRINEVFDDEKKKNAEQTFSLITNFLFSLSLFPSLSTYTNCALNL